MRISNETLNMCVHSIALEQRRGGLYMPSNKPTRNTPEAGFISSGKEEECINGEQSMWYLSRSVRICYVSWAYAIVGSSQESKARHCIGCCQEVGVILCLGILILSKKE